MFFKMKPIEKWTHVKTVMSYSQHKNKAGIYDIVGCGYSVLLERKESGQRKMEFIGLKTNSPAALETEAAVVAWLHGGPIPDGMEWEADAPNPKPRKPLPVKKKKPKEAKGNVVPFPQTSQAAA